MAPSTSTIETVQLPQPIREKVITKATRVRQPLNLSGALDAYQSFDVTPVIGREFPEVQLTSLLSAKNSHELLRDLAITISQRGVVFFRNQDITIQEQKALGSKLGELAGKPPTSKLHIHPVYNAARDAGINDNEISTISSEQNKKLYTATDFGGASGKRQSDASSWHSDITFEPIPSDYAILKIIELPATGGDTLWASGYEVFDRISKPYQTFLEGLTATHSQPDFNAAASRGGFTLFTQARGAPENVGEDLTAVHPVIRTNPVTGWKSVFAVGHHVKHINGLSKRESDHLLKEFLKLVTTNHDLQVRFKWQKNDVAIWDNVRLPALSETVDSD
ncbi:hypothetical protein Q9L58_006133 [Maublancomyces gigas]|uniref:TauD/TfdA-like domain-containing protein n=1 Tax=Discina gigas TaxID=1032678 RepID=A0ABR3GG83_9PEZI